MVEKERRIAEEITREEGKPEQAIPKIVEGRVNAFFKDVVLTEQASVKDPKQTIKSVLAAGGRRQGLRPLPRRPGLSRRALPSGGRPSDGGVVSG